MDTELLDKTRKGDLDAFSQLVEKYKDFAYSTALRILKNSEDAEEALQDSFLKVYKAIDSFKGNSKFSTWLFRIVYNTAISRLRKRRHNNQSIGENSAEIDAVAVQSSIDTLAEKEKREIIDAVLDSMPREEGTILTLYYLQEFTVTEIGEIMGLTISNVKVRLFRARKRFYNGINQLLEDDMEISR